MREKQERIRKKRDEEKAKVKAIRQKMQQKLFGQERLTDSDEDDSKIRTDTSMTSKGQYGSQLLSDFNKTNNQAFLQQ